MPKKDKGDWVKFHKALGDRLELFWNKRSCPICGYSPEILGKTTKKLLARQKQEIVNLLDEYPRMEITFKDGSKTKVLLEHLIKQWRDIVKKV